MPATIDVQGFPVPVDLDEDHKEWKKHLTRLTRIHGEGINRVGEAAFSPLTTVSNLKSDTTINSTVATDLTDLGQTIVVPVPSRLWFTMTIDAEQTVAAAGSLLRVRMKFDGTTIQPRINWLPIDLDRGPLTVCGPTTNLLLNPETAYAITVEALLVNAGATYVLLAADSCLTIRCEPRLL